MELSFRVRERKIVGDGTTQIDKALQDINEEIVKYLSNHEVSAKATVENKSTPLHWAISVGCEEIVKILLDKKTDIDVTDRDESIPLLVAEQDLFSQIGDLISSSETLTGANSRSESALSNHGTIHGYHWLLMNDIEYKADVNALDEHGRTPLHIALKNGKKSIAMLLIDSYGADVNAKNIDRFTPLHYAVRQECQEISQSLLEYGANVNARDVYGITPLHVAAATRCFWISNLLLRKGADVNARDTQGKTPLHYAVAQEKICKKMVETLLDAGSDVNIMDNQGRTPISTYYDNSGIYRTFFRYRRCKYLVNSRRVVSKCKVSNWYRPIIRLFRLHTLKLRAAGLYVNEKNLQHLRKDGFRLDHETREWIQNLSQELRHHHLRAYKEELEKMKSIKLGVKVSLYDVLITNEFKHRPNRITEWNLKRLSREFPIYQSLLKNKSELKRLLLLQDSKRSFSSLSKTFLPNEMLEKIFSHLNNEDLQNLILASRIDKLNR